MNFYPLGWSVHTHIYYLGITVPADALALLGDRPSADTLLITKLRHEFHQSINDFDYIFNMTSFNIATKISKYLSTIQQCIIKLLTIFTSIYSYMFNTCFLGHSDGYSWHN